MFKKPISILSIICGVLSLALVLDYLLWPHAIKASEDPSQGIQVKISAGIVFLLLSLIFNARAKKLESTSWWTKTSGVLNFLLVLTFVLSILFYAFIEITKF